jgi:hypothetical protein
MKTACKSIKYSIFIFSDTINFEDLQAYDVADLLKQYFRELPECLMTNKLSEIFLNVFICKLFRICKPPVLTIRKCDCWQFFWFSMF